MYDDAAERTSICYASRRPVLATVVGLVISSLLTWPGSAIVNNLVIPPSDVSRTKPLTRLVINQIGRRLTEELHLRNRRHRMLLMLDEFPALASTSSSRRSPS